MDGNRALDCGQRQGGDDIAQCEGPLLSGRRGDPRRAVEPRLARRLDVIVREGNWSSLPDSRPTRRPAIYEDFRRRAAGFPVRGWRYFLNASLIFSPASFKFDFAWSARPRSSVSLSPVTRPAASLAFPPRF